MKLLFSEYKSDYTNYIFPYAIWAIPEEGETPAMMFASGFLPGSRNLDRYYLCRQVRVRLRDFSPSSENRRIFRKCEGIDFKLIPRQQFNYTTEWRDFCKTYADIKFGKDVMTYERLDSLFNSKILTHLMLYTDREKDQDVGLVTLFLEEPQMAYYYYAFYDLNYYPRNLGMYMMTSAVDFFARKQFDFIYLGTCYSRTALYKTQFNGAEFFNGCAWSKNLKELKYLIARDKGPVTRHLLETEEYLEKFYENNLNRLAHNSFFKISN